MKRSQTCEDLTSDKEEPHKRSQTCEDLTSDSGEPRKKKMFRFKIPKKGSKSPNKQQTSDSDLKSDESEQIKSNEKHHDLSKTDKISRSHGSSANDNQSVQEEHRTDTKTSSHVENNLEKSDKSKVATSSKSNAELARQHYNSLQQINRHKRHESKIFNLRGFNNYIKSLVMSDFLGRLGPLGRGGATVLDLGCGKGGDLGKWGLAKPAHLVCVDIADVSVAQCKDRYQERPNFNADFIVADCSRDKLDDKFKEHGIQGIEFDLVSCQFALHYGFESQNQAIRMIKNAVSHLKPGCFFFGTIPNSNYLVKKYLSQSANSSPDSDVPPSSKFGNDVYYVDFLEPGRTNFPLFGAEYVFYLDGAVQALPEFLIHFPLLEAMLQEEGCECVLAEPFIDYIYKSRDESRDAKSHDPASPDVTDSRDDDTEEVKCRNKSGELKDVSVVARTRGLNAAGTLLQQEWEVVACYMAFGFRKLTEEERELQRDSKRRKVS